MLAGTSSPVVSGSADEAGASGVVVGAGGSEVGAGASVVGSGVADGSADEEAAELLSPGCIASGTSSCSPERGVVSRPQAEPALLRLPP